MNMHFRWENIKILKRCMKERKIIMSNSSIILEREKLYHEIWEIS